MDTLFCVVGVDYSENTSKGPGFLEICSLWVHVAQERKNLQLGFGTRLPIGIHLSQDSSGHLSEVIGIILGFGVHPALGDDGNENIRTPFGKISHKFRPIIRPEVQQGVS